MPDVQKGRPKIRLNANRYPGPAARFGWWDRRLKNEKLYEQSQQVIEKQRTDIFEAKKSLKTAELSLLSQEVIDNEGVAGWERERKCAAVLRDTRSSGLGRAGLSAPSYRRPQAKLF
jgi:hypothetical protein